MIARDDNRIILEGRRAQNNGHARLQRRLSPRVEGSVGVVAHARTIVKRDRNLEQLSRNQQRVCGASCADARGLSTHRKFGDLVMSFPSPMELQSTGASVRAVVIATT
jgi:hypothetical protein